MPECQWKLDPGLDKEHWDLYDTKQPTLKGFEKRLRTTVPVAKVSWDPGALDIFFWAGECGISLTKDIWEEFTPTIAEEFAITCEQVYKAVTGITK